MISWMDETMPWGPLLVSAVCAAVVSAVAFREWWVGWVRRTWARRRRAPERKPVDMVAVAEVEHDLADEHPDKWGPDTWVHDCTGYFGLYQACAERRVAAARASQGGPVAAPGGFLEVRGVLTVNEQRELARRFWRAEARPAVLVGDVQVLSLPCPECDTFEVAAFGQERPVARYKQLCGDCQARDESAADYRPGRGTVDLETGVEPDGPGPE